MTVSTSQRERDTGRRTALASLVVIALCGCAIWIAMTPSQSQLEQMAIDAVAQNDLPKAEAALLRIRNRDVDVLRLLADVTHTQGRKRECLRWLEELAKGSPEPMSLYCEAGARAFEFALPREAERLYRQAIEASPTSLEPYQRLARLYVAWHRGDDLRAVIADADRHDAPLIDDPALLWFWVVGDRVEWQDDDSRQWLESAAAETPDDPYIVAALIRASLEPASTTRQKDPSVPTPAKGTSAWPVALARAEADLNSNRVEESLATLKTLPAEGERYAQTWFIRGRIAETVGDSDSAITAFDYASRLDPFYVAPLYQRGHLMARIGKTAESESQLGLALRLDELVRLCLRQLQSNQRNPEDLILIANLGAELGQKRWAQLVCKLILSIDPGKRLPEPLASLSETKLMPLTLPSPGSLLQFAVTKPRSINPVPETNSASQSSDFPKVQFSETTQELGLDFRYEYGHTRERWLMETLGAGVAVLDYDLDGWPDLFFAQGGPLSTTPTERVEYGQLVRNVRGTKLSNVTTASNAVVAGYAHGCAVGDVNNDGFPDLLVCRYGGMSLCLNQGDGTWTASPIFGEPDSTGNDPSQGNQSSSDPSHPTNAALQNWNTSASFVDLDSDGALDIYVAGYCHAPLSTTLRTCRDDGKPTPCRPGTYPAEPDTLLINLGTGAFDDRSHAYGIHDDRGYGLGVIAADFDRDGLPEIFVGNDTTQNFFWHRPNRSATEFLEIGLLSGVAVDGSGRAEACMGIACGDVDGDMQLDLFVTNFFDETCTFYQNLGGLQFEDRTQAIGLSNAGRQLMGWGCQFFDADNDGWLDLAILNGHLHDTPQLSQFYYNLGGRFTERSSTAGSYFQYPKIGRAMATWDYNRDGRIDLVTTHQTETASILRNDTEVGHHLTLTLVGTSSPRDATGATVTAKFGNRSLLRLVSSQGGYLSACSSQVNLGLGVHDSIDELEINWPSGQRQRFENLPANQHLLIREGNAELIMVSK